jgi:hypothetical protein
MEGGRVVGGIVGNWDVTVTFKLQVPGVAREMAEQLALASFSVGVPAASWLRQAETSSSPSENPAASLKGPFGKGGKS